MAVAESKTPYDFEKQIFMDHMKDLPDICLRELSHDALKKSVQNCQLCPHSKLTKPLPLNNFGARIMIIGETPDDVLFETPSGRMLGDMLMKHRFDLKDVYLTAVIKCRESKNHEQCLSYLIAEVLTVRPTLAICLGYNVSRIFDDRPQLGQFKQILPNVYTLATFSFRDESSNALPTLDQQFAYISKKLQEMRIA
jgi:uracil-DNA glycosylase family 4